MSRTARHAASHAGPVLVVVMLSVFAFALLQSLINPVLPQLQAELHTTQSMITWVVTAFLLSAAVFTPILGRLGDRYGKDRMLVLALVALAVGSLVSALATDISAMIVGRAIQGIGGSVMPLVFGIIRDELPRERVPGAIGLASALIAVGGGVGLLLSGPLVDWLGLRSLFWIPLAVTASTPPWPPWSSYLPRRRGTAGRLVGFRLSCWLAACSPCWCRSPRARSGAGGRAR